MDKAIVFESSNIEDSELTNFISSHSSFLSTVHARHTCMVSAPGSLTRLIAVEMQG